jgi:hypothetical protein
MPAVAAALLLLFCSAHLHSSVFDLVMTDEPTKQFKNRLLDIRIQIISEFG